MDGKLVKVFANNMVDMKNFVDFDPEECGITEKVSFPVLCQLLDQYSGEELKEAVADHVDDLVPKHITVADIMASINYLNGLAHNGWAPPMTSTTWATAACAAWAS